MFNEVKQNKFTYLKPYRFRLITILVLTLLTHFSFSQSFNWAKQFGLYSNDYVDLNKIVSDTNSNIYSTGYFKGTPDFDPGPGTYTMTNLLGTINVFVMKVNTSGNLVWAIQFDGYSEGSSIAVDDSANVYITGSCDNNTDFDPGPGIVNFPSISSTNTFFVCKLKSNGNLCWVKAISSIPTNNIKSRDIAVDKLGNVLITGNFGGVTDFNPGSGTYTLTTASNRFDIFVLKLNVVGNFVWAGKMGANIDDDYGYSITTDNSGNVYTTGSFYTWSGNNADFDPGPGTYTLASIWDDDIFVSKLDVNGNFVWAKSMGGGSFNLDRGNSIAVDKYKNVYTTGIYGGGAGNDFDPGPSTYSLISNGMQDAFVSKLDSSGNFIWAKTIGGASVDEANTITTDRSGKVYVGGAFIGIADVDPGSGTYLFTASTSTLTSVFQDGFIVKLDTNGTFLWAGQITGGSSEPVKSLISDKSKNIYAAGWFGTGNTSIDLDPGFGVYSFTAIGATQNDMFLLKLSPCSAPVSPTNTTLPANKIFCSNKTTTLSVIVSSGIINWYSSSTSTLSVGGGTTFVTPVLAAGNYTYFAEASGCWTSPVRIPITFTVIPVPSLTITATPSVTCAGQTVTLSVMGAANYLWNTSATTSIITVNPLTTSLYTVSGTASGCSSTASYFATIDSPTININASVLGICKGDTVTLTCNGANTYTWNTGATNTLIAVTPSVNTTYSIIGNSVYNCTSTSALTINVFPVPSLTITASDSVICFGTGIPVLLTGYGAQYYFWDIINNSQTYVVTPTVTTIYTLKGLDLNYCSSIKTFTVRVNPCIGIKEIELNGKNVYLYPNPTNNIIHLNFTNSPQDITLQVFNSTGEMILEQKEIGLQNEIELSELASGIYQLKLNEKGKIPSYFKLIKL